MKQPRSYDMASREAAAAATRERILAAAADAFLERWYDDVTIAEVARRAGVSGQTVLNHFGAKERLFAAAHARLGDDLRARRHAPEPGDVAGAIAALVADYEITGDATIRMLALEEKVPRLRALIDEGRAGHRDWVERMFAAPALTPELVVATDVYAWKLLRRDQGLDAGATAAAMRRMVEALLATAPENGRPRTRRSR
jgi:AcrR family transcriptional regulator